MEPKFGYQAFVKRTRLKQREIAEKVGATQGLVGHWAIGRGVPSYEKLGGLIELGMTAQEMFGEELGNLLVGNSGGSRSRVDKDELQAAVKAVLSDLSKSI